MKHTILMIFILLAVAGLLTLLDSETESQFPKFTVTSYKVFAFGSEESMRTNSWLGSEENKDALTLSRLPAGYWNQTFNLGKYDILDCEENGDEIAKDISSGYRWKDCNNDDPLPGSVGLYPSPVRIEIYPYGIYKNLKKYYEENSK